MDHEKSVSLFIPPGVDKGVHAFCLTNWKQHLATEFDNHIGEWQLDVGPEES